MGITACSRGMSQKPSPAQKKALLVKLAVVAVAGLVGAVLVLRGLDVKALFNDTLALVRQVGPEAFFAGMAILPALGFPMSPFWLSAGPVFTPVLGLPMVIGLCAVSLAVNLAFTYWLARYAFRPPLVWLVRRLGYELPHVAVADQVEVTVLLRVTPGPPFFYPRLPARAGGDSVQDVPAGFVAHFYGVWRGVYFLRRLARAGQRQAGTAGVWRGGGAGGWIQISPEADVEEQGLRLW